MENPHLYAWQLWAQNNAKVANARRSAGKTILHENMSKSGAEAAILAASNGTLAEIKVLDDSTHGIFIPDFITGRYIFEPYERQCTSSACLSMQGTTRYLWVFEGGAQADYVLAGNGNFYNPVYPEPLEGPTQLHHYADDTVYVIKGGVPLLSKSDAFTQTARAYIACVPGVSVEIGLGDPNPAALAANGGSALSNLVAVSVEGVSRDESLESNAKKSLNEPNRPNQYKKQNSWIIGKHLLAYNPEWDMFASVAQLNWAWGADLDDLRDFLVQLGFESTAGGIRDGGIVGLDGASSVFQAVFDNHYPTFRRCIGKYHSSDAWRAKDYSMPRGFMIKKP